MTIAPPTLKTGITSRADLIDLLADPVRESSHLVIEAIGFEAIEQLPQPGRPLRNKAESIQRNQKAAADIGWTQFQPQPVRFWRVVSATKKERPEKTDRDQDGETRDDSSEPRRPEELVRELESLMPPSLQWQALSTESSVLTRLRKAAAANRSRLEMDIPRAVELLSRGRFLYRIPRRARKVWGHDLLVIEDRSRRLVPYWKDQDLLSEWLYKIYPESGFQCARLQEGHDQLRLMWPRALRDRPLQLPPPGTLVLALTDLGALWRPRHDQEPCEVWERWGRMLRDNGNQALALIPCGCERIPPRVAAFWHLIPWDAAQHSASAATRKSLLRLIAPCVRLEPELLRALRLLVPDARRDAGLEASIWQDPLLDSANSISAPINPQKRLELLPEFDHEAEDLRKAALQCIPAARRQTPSTWIEELISLNDASPQIELIQAQLELARQWFVALRRHTNDVTLRRSAGWLERLGERLPELLNLPDNVRRVLEELCALVRHPEGGSVHRWQNQHLPWRDGDEQTVRVLLAGDRLNLADDPSRRDANSVAGSHRYGSFLADIRTVSGEIRLREAVISEGTEASSSDNFWRAGTPPSWIREFGDDRFGLWCTFKVKDVLQRMRWVAPGTFQMGSPDDEQGRDPDEGPRHPVTISCGFWMFDTPCTQALWEAVTGETSAHFKGPNRPVEQVSWIDVQKFMHELNSLLPGLELRLPTEAEWEFSCRAGSEEARYGQLDAIAWYSGNSDSTTHDVGQKEPNAWGFYDLLGNVYEWCQDNWCRRYEETLALDPLYEADEGASRVIRGGSWGSPAQFVRAAYRRGWHPEGRGGSVGFRCLSSPEPSQPSDAAMSVSESKRSGAEPTANSESPRSGATILRVTTRHIRLSDARSLQIVASSVSRWDLETDRETVTIARAPAPSWANQGGRDKYGLWAELAVGDVRQRLRWIPPGRFLMGTPAKEEGRQSWELAPREVTLTAGFWMFDSPCTQQLWSAVMNDTPSHFKGPLRPVEQISWLKCQEFLVRLNEQFDNLNLRLPSETQWEYACRAGTTTARYGELDDIAWYGDNSGGESHDVKSKRPNSWGLFDMLGNVYEWCQDHWHTEDDTMFDVDPIYERADSGAFRVIRGGGWRDPALFVRAAYRRNWRPEDRSSFVGFRCLSSPEPRQPSGAAMSVSESKRSGAEPTANSESPRSGAKIGIVDRAHRWITGRDPSRD